MYGDEDRRTNQERLAERCGLKKDASPEEVVAAALTLIHELDRRPVYPPVVAIQSPPAFHDPGRTGYPSETPLSPWRVYCQAPPS